MGEVTWNADPAAPGYWGKEKAWVAVRTEQVKISRQWGWTAHVRPLCTHVRRWNRGRIMIMMLWDAKKWWYVPRPNIVHRWTCIMGKIERKNSLCYACTKKKMCGAVNGVERCWKKEKKMWEGLSVWGKKSFEFDRVRREGEIFN